MADDRDAARLRELGYEQELRRGLRGLGNVAIGFATISPVVALYAIVFVGFVVAGPAWIWALPVVLAGQCLLLALYSELSSEFPVANGAYQWTRRLIGPRYAWFNGWVTLCAYAVANTTIAYLAAPWALTLLDVEPTPQAIVVTGILLVVIAALVNAGGIDVLRRFVSVGIVAEVIASVGIGITLLLAFRVQDAAILTDTLGAEALSDGSVVAALLTALAVGGWAFIGFDACIMTAEETRGADRQVPRAIWIALLSVGAIVLLDAFAVTLAHDDPTAIVAGRDTDPVTTTVVTAFGDWSTKPFAAVVLVAFLACLMAAQGASARAIFSVARDGALPGSAFLRRVGRRQVPGGALLATTLVAALGMLVGLEATAIGSIITFGTAAIYVGFLLVAVAALTARLTGRWIPAGTVRLGRAGAVLNLLAVAWLAFETVNVAWPRASLAPPDAPFYEIWAAPLVLVVIGATGLVYLAVARPQQRLRA
jgi:amino acid transporter